MKIDFPKEKHLEFEPQLEHGGRLGAVEAAHSILGFYGADFDLDELLVASSAAAAQYVYDPDLNGHEDERRLYSPYSSYFSNYGVFESLSHYTGWEFGELNGLSQTDLKKLLMFEMADGRPLISFGVGGQQVPQLIYGYEREGLEFTLQIQSPEGKFEYHLSDEKLQAEDEVFVNYAVIVRADDRHWYLEPERQRVALLRWMYKHWNASKEFFHETRENYASGLAGVEAFGTLLGEFSTADEWSFATEHVAATRRSRATMRDVISRWATSIAEQLGSEEVGARLEALSQKAGKVADELASFDPADVDAWQEIVELERAWVEELGHVHPYLPSPFG